MRVFFTYHYAINKAHITPLQRKTKRGKKFGMQIASAITHNHLNLGCSTSCTLVYLIFPCIRGIHNATSLLQHDTEH